MNIASRISALAFPAILYLISTPTFSAEDFKYQRQNEEFRQKIQQEYTDNRRRFILGKAYCEGIREKIAGNFLAHWPMDGTKKLSGIVSIVFSINDDGSLYAPADIPKLNTVPEIQ
jgi:hypothetical protein